MLGLPDFCDHHSQVSPQNILPGLHTKTSFCRWRSVRTWRATGDPRWSKAKAKGSVGERAQRKKEKKKKVDPLGLQLTHGPTNPLGTLGLQP